MLHPSVVEPVSDTCSAGAPTSDAERRAGFRPQPEHPLEVLLAETAVLQLVVELRPDGVSRRLRDRAEGTRVEIGEPLEHREERPRLRGRHPIVTSTGAWSESTAPL